MQTVRPAFSAEATLGFAMPLIITTLTGQFLTGLAILKANGFDTPARPILTVASVLSIPAAVFGGITIALASITMAIGASEECHPDPGRRYVAGVSSGAFLMLGGLLAGSVVSLYQVLPVELLPLLAGLALLGAIGKGLADLMADSVDRDAGLLTFVVTASGLAAFGIGAAVPGPRRGSDHRSGEARGSAHYARTCEWPTAAIGPAEAEGKMTKGTYLFRRGARRYGDMLAGRAARSAACRMARHKIRRATRCAMAMKLRTCTPCSSRR